MKIIGHRGARGLAPENTLESIEQALKHGVDAVEFDVHLTLDGVMALHHDHDLLLAQTTRAPIKQLSVEQLRSHKPDLTTLQDALRVIDGKAEAMVEIKEHVDPMPICKELEIYRKRGKAVSVLSFDYDVLRQVRLHFPELPLVVNEKWSSVRAVWRARRLGTARIQMNQRWLWRGVLRSLRHRGFSVNAYTVNNPHHIAAWRPYICGVVTDRPDLFRQ